MLKKDKITLFAFSGVVALLVAISIFSGGMEAPGVVPEVTGNVSASHLKTPDGDIENGLPRLQSLNQLLGMLKASGVVYDDTTKGFGLAGDAAAPSAPSAAPAERASGTAANQAEGASRDYSSVNSQVSGVNEGDILQTDGKYIYTVQNNAIYIYKVDGADMSLASRIELKDNSVSEMYVSGDRLVTVSSRYEQGAAYPPDAPDTPRIAADIMIYPRGKGYSVYTVYDITDRAKPVVAKTFEVEGSHAASRMIENRLYFVANKNIYYIMDKYNDADILPSYREGGTGTFKSVPATDIAYFPGVDITNNYMMVGSMDILGDEPASFESYLNAGNSFYMSAENLYVACGAWDANGERTMLYCFEVTDGGLKYATGGEVGGYVLNQYSMDEYDGYFRIATTMFGKGNFITVLDKELKVQGSTQALSPDETIHSARFMGKVAYIVTYRQTDPLYAIDLSDPKNPKVLGELKIPGFSQYLHPVGEGLLVGFGRHTTETYVRDLKGKEIVVGTYDMGTKVSLFDISDPFNLREVDIMLLGQNTYSEAFTNPRALMVDPQRHRFGFSMSDYSYEKRESMNRIRIISVENGALKDLADIGQSAPSSGSYYDLSYGARLAYIGNTLYSVNSYGITAYDMTSFNELASVKH